MPWRLDCHQARSATLALDPGLEVKVARPELRIEVLDIDESPDGSKAALDLAASVVCGDFVARTRFWAYREAVRGFADELRSVAQGSLRRADLRCGTGDTVEFAAAALSVGGGGGATVQLEIGQDSVSRRVGARDVLSVEFATDPVSAEQFARELARLPTTPGFEATLVGL